MPDGACASLLCDNCRSPGRCCTGFHLNVPDEPTALQMLVQMAVVFHTALGEPALGLPLMPLYRQSTGRWRWWCPLLVKGRCSDYGNRPDLCRSYPPGHDPLCAMHVPEPDLSPSDA